MKQWSPQRIAILGIGAMGCLLGACLRKLPDGKKHPPDVLLIGQWPAQIKAIRHYGLTVISLDAQKEHYSPKITDAENISGKFDLLFLLRKSYQNSLPGNGLKEMLNPGGIAITLQNGYGALRRLQETVGQSQAAAGITLQAATVLEPGIIRHAGAGDTFIQPISGRRKDFEALAELLAAAGWPVTLTDNLKPLIWGKLTINTAINPLTALLNVPNGRLPERTDLWTISAAVARETARIAAIEGVYLSAPLVINNLREACRATAGNISSMLQDIRRGALTEVEDISGAVVACAAGRPGMAAPLNLRLLELVRQLQAGKLSAEQEWLAGLLKLAHEQNNKFQMKDMQ